MQPGSPDADQSKTMTLEAFADTIIPGEKRFPEDRAIAGVTAGGGAVQSGAMELFAHPALGFAEMLDGLAVALNEHAKRYAGEHRITLDESVPAFVALSFDHRTALVQALTSVGHPEKAFWFALALFSTMAFDSAPHLPTAVALRSAHPGIVAMGFTKPNPDGLWRFPEFSYGRPLADRHPHTTSTGSPA